MCPFTGADDVESVALPRDGRLWAWTAVTHPPPGYEGPVPYGFGVVELDGVGLRVVTRLTEPDPTRLHEGQRMHPGHRRRRRRGRHVGLRPGARMSIEVGVGGVGMHPFGRFDDAGLVDLGVTAVQQAMTEAGIGPGGFQAAYCGTAYGGVATGHRVLGALALTGTPIIDVEAGCASGGAALQLGGQAIASGRHDTVLVLGVEKMPKGIIRSSFFAPGRSKPGCPPPPPTSPCGPSACWPTPA